MYDEANNYYNYIGFLDMLQNWDVFDDPVKADFEEMHDDLHAYAVRLIVYPKHLEFGDPNASDKYGMDYPVPSDSDLNNLRDIIDAAADKNLKVYLVLLLPKEYANKDSDGYDYEYAGPLAYIDENSNYHNGNGIKRELNHNTYLETIFDEVLNDRESDIMMVNLFGDFDPCSLNIPEISDDECVRGTVQDGILIPDTYQQLWLKRICSWVLNPSNSIYSIFPNYKKTYELVGGAGYPNYFIAKEIQWVKEVRDDFGLPLPTKIGVEIYADYEDWTNNTALNNTRFDAYFGLFQMLANELGQNGFIIEEIGVDTNTDCDAGHPHGPASNDGLNGINVFSAAFSALEYFDPTIPIGIWVFSDTLGCEHTGESEGYYGIFTTGLIYDEELEEYVRIKKPLWDYIEMFFTN